MLSKVGITAKLQNVEWAQWLSNVYGNKNYDMTIISHVEPFDLGNFAKPDYYWNYQNPKFNELYDRIKTAQNPADRARLLGDAQRLLARGLRPCLPVPAAVDHGGQQERPGPVEGHADLRQRPVGDVLGLRQRAHDQAVRAPRAA